MGIDGDYPRFPAAMFGSMAAGITVAEVPT